MADRIAFRMPTLGADMVHGTVLAWHVSPGDTVAVGDLVALVDTDKSEIDIESFEAGVVDELVVPEGTEVPVGTVIAYLRAPASQPAPTAPVAPVAPVAPAPVAPAPATPATPVAPVAPVAPAPVAPVGTPAPAPGPAPAVAPPAAPGPVIPEGTVPPLPSQSPAVGTRTPATPDDAVGGHRVEPRIVSPLVRRLAEARHVDPAALHGSGPGEQVLRRDVEALPVRTSPRARRLAAREGVDLGAVTGTGSAGAVTGDDVLRHLAARPADSAPPGPVTAEGSTGTPSTAAAAAPDPTRDRRRAATAELMSRSWREIPHFHLATRADVSALTGWLARTNEARPITGRLLPAALLLRATAVAAARHPTLNGWWTDGTFRPADRVDLGVVVALRGGGLLAPTITDAASRPVEELMVALHDVVTRARRGRLRSGDTAPASISVTNLGELGVDEVHGVIHPPQVALVGFGSIHEEPWASGGMVAARPVLHVTLAGDHRASDGLAGAAFLADIVRLLADPEHL